MKKLEVLLISPPAPGLEDKLSYPPLGILYLASNLDLENYYNVDILNMYIIDEDIKSDYDIYGVSIHSVSTYDSARVIMKKIRDINNNALIIAGGSFPTNMIEFTLANTEADMVVVGEGEKIFSNICKNYYDKTKLKEVNGIAYKGNNRIVINKLEQLIENLDFIKFPDRHLLPKYMIKHEGKVHHSDKPATTIFATRGCVYNCSFCDTNLWRRRWRSRSPENIISEIEEIKREYEINWFRFPDDCLNLNKKWFYEFCNSIMRCNVEWTMLSRADTIDIEMLKLMKKAGCREIFFGFESGSQKLLDAMNKKTTVEKNIKAIEMCREVGIISCAYMMFGFPGEDERTVEETKQFLLKSRPDKSRISTFIPIPGTDVWNHPEKYKVKIKSNFTDYWYFDCPEFGLEYEYISNDKIEKLRQDMMNFYRTQGYFEYWQGAKK